MSTRVVKFEAILALFVVTLLTATSARAQVVDSINAANSPIAGDWDANTYGILYTPSGTYTVGRIEANWGGSNADGRTITIQVFDENPNGGGVLLAAGSFPQTTAGWQGADLDNPVTFTAGEDYFIGFSNTVGTMGRFFAGDAGADQFTVWYAFAPGTYTTEDNGNGYHDPIWRFLATAGAVSLPAEVPALGDVGRALLILLLGLSGVALALRT